MATYGRIFIMLSLAGCLTGTHTWAQKNSGNTARPSDTTNAVRQPQTESPVSGNTADATGRDSVNIIRKVTSDADFSTLYSAIRQAGLEATLSNPGPFTVFAPTNKAFNDLPAGTLRNLMRGRSKETLSSILRFHVVPGRITMADLEDGQKLKTVNGEELSVTRLNGRVAVNGVELNQSDLEVANGVIHVLDKVLLPPHTEIVGNKK